MSAWRVARYLAVVVILLFVGDRVVALGLDEAIRFSSMPHAKLYSGRGRADVIILGNSRALRHFDEVQLARALGLSVSNLAVLGSSMETMNVILDDYIARYGPPRAVIIEPSCMSGNNDHIRNLQIYTRRSFGLQAILQKTSPLLAAAGQISHLFTLNGSAYFNVIHKMISPYRQVFLEGSGRLDAVQPADRSYFFNRKDNEVALEKTLQTLERHRIRFEVVVTPVFAGFQATGAGFRQWVSTLSERLASEAGIANYADLALPPSAFHDPVHLNRVGVATFFDRLVQDGVMRRLGKD